MLRSTSSQNLDKPHTHATSELQPKKPITLQNVSQSQCDPLIQRFNATQLTASIARLENLASAILIFKSRFDDLTSHLHFIEKSIEARNASSEDVSKPSETPIPQHCAELKFLCETNNGKALRKHLIKYRLHNVDSLREELPIAIKASLNPARLVLDCSGGFFKQGIRAYEKVQALVQARLVGVIALEALFLSVDDKSIEVDNESRSEAEQRALMWRNRMISEGGIRNAGEMDASGLLFLIVAFEVARVFSDEDVLDLVVITMKTNLSTLKRSDLLINTLKSVLERMIGNEAKIEAIEVVRVFEMEDEFPLEMVTKGYIEVCNKALNQRRTEAKTNPSLLKKAHAKHIEGLKSALKFLEDNGFDSLKPLFEEAITKSEKVNSAKQKRKPMGNGDDRNAKRMRTQGGMNNNSSIIRHDLGALPAYRGVPVIAPMCAEVRPGFAGYIGSPPRGEGVGDVSQIELYGFVDKVVMMEYGHLFSSGSSVFSHPPSYLRL